MVSLDAIREDLGKLQAIDKEIHSVDIIANTLEEALADAGVQLDTKIANLDYEILEKGFAGVAGIAKKPWKIRVYENARVVEKKLAEEYMLKENATQAEEVKQIDKDGMFYVHYYSSDICLKIIVPEGAGKGVQLNDVLAAVRRPDTLSIDENVIKKVLKEGTGGEYVIIGSYNHVGSADALLAVDVQKDEMKAFITVSPPGMSGSEVSADQIKSSLRLQGVVAGIEDDKITEFVDNPTYNFAYEVAAAVLPVNGRDAYIDYKFETDKTKLKLKETENGQVDFKELNLIQNVVAGQPLAQKMLAERGKGGKTITGRYLEATNGKDITVTLGANVRFDTDGRTIIAEKNGQVMLVGDKITVEEVYEVQGVNIKTGNINFMGTVVCRGNVEDGFNIKAAGNIEVYGTVGNSLLEAEGDIVISQGVMGRDEGKIVTPKSVWARFIQNTNVDAGEYVVVNDNIMNSHVVAMKKIIVKGKRASIIGGNLFATEEISAKNIGSPGGGVETVLEVGYDPKAKARLMELQEMQSNLVKELEEVDLNISTLENQKQVRKSLPKDKEENLKKLIVRKTEIIDENNGITEEIQKIESHLRDLKVVGRVNASGTVYAGSKIFVRDEKDEVKNDCKAVCFYYDNGFVRRGKFDQNNVTKDIKGPDGYSSD